MLLRPPAFDFYNKVYYYIWRMNVRKKCEGDGFAV